MISLLAQYHAVWLVIYFALQREAVMQSKIALRLVRSLEETKHLMFEAMASYDWETVLKCLDAGLGANDEAPNVCVAFLCELL